MRSIGRMSSAKAAVLSELLARPTDAHWGYDLMKKTKLSSGTLYPVLSQLEQAGWVRGSWETDKKAKGGPPRRAYRLTGHGLRSAPDALLRFAGRRRHRSSLPTTRHA